MTREPPAAQGRPFPVTVDAQLRETLEATGLEPADIERDPRATIRASVERDASEPIDVAARLAGEELEIHETLGEGGMGVVRGAIQPRLGRPVAVKELRPEHVDEAAVRKLVREAWVIGGLEHPNVIPVHDIRIDANGLPQIVLKRVEGEDWSALLREPDRIRERFGVEDVLEQNIRILMQVSNAISFAHSRGILHRDIKPENVMIGQFGEIYVADWGLAVAMEDDGTGRFPLARDVHTIGGTPAYMAPEQAWGGGRLGPWTDVYLLGATLYELVVGRPPHRGETFGALMHAIATSRPELPEDLSPALAALLRRAMDPQPTERFESAEAFRLALGAFLEHRGAARLVAGARASLDRLRELAGRADAAQDEVYRVFGQCRFACQQALEQWPHAEEAQDALREASVLLVERELSRGEPEAARALLAEVAEPPEALAARVEAAVEARVREESRLRGLARDLHPATGKRLRIWLASVVGVAWTLLPLTIEYARRTGWPMPHTGALTWNSIGVVALLIGGVAFWNRIKQSALTRRLWLATLTVSGIQLVMHGGDTFAGVDAMSTTIHQFPVWSAIALGLTVGVDVWFLVPAALYAGAFLLLSVYPELAFPLMSACNASVLVVVFRLSRRG